jgi:glucan phosphoethanolaminetransferase (alkaline phosphatase superfamily)
MVPVIVSILVPLLLYFLNKASKQNVAALNDGSYELRMNTAYLIIGAAGVIVSLLFLLLPVLADEYSIGIFTVSGIMFLLFMGFSVPCFLWYKNHHLSFNEAGFISRSAYGKSQQIKWHEINQVRFSAFMGVLYVTNKQGDTVKAHQHLVGFSSFIKMLQIQKDKYHFASESLPLRMLGLTN